MKVRVDNFKVSLRFLRFEGFNRGESSLRFLRFRGETE